MKVNEQSLRNDDSPLPAIACPLKYPVLCDMSMSMSISILLIFLISRAVESLKSLLLLLVQLFQMKFYDHCDIFSWYDNSNDADEMRTNGVFKWYLFDENNSFLFCTTSKSTPTQLDKNDVELECSNENESHQSEDSVVCCTVIENLIVALPPSAYPFLIRYKRYVHGQTGYVDLYY